MLGLLRWGTIITLNTYIGECFVRDAYKTLTCVLAAGIIFIYSILMGPSWLFLVAAFFDWLPLPTGWMRIKSAGRSRRSRRAGIIHGAVTLVAYAIGIAWLIGLQPTRILGLLFLEAWFTAVILGSYTTIEALGTQA